MHGPNLIHRYYRRSRWFLVILFCASLVILVWSLTYGSWADVFAGMALCAICAVGIWSDYIQTSPEGIRWRAYLSTVESSWENVEGVAKVQFDLWPQRCILLKQNSEQGLPTELDWTIPKNKRGRKIPLPDRPRWGRYHDQERILEDIKQFAPHAKIE